MNSSDEEINKACTEMSLYGILEERKDAVCAAEIWALLKESCVHLKFLLEQKLPIEPFSLSDMILDSNGNIKINRNGNRERILQETREKKSIIQYLGEAMMFIIDRYTGLDYTNDLFMYMLELINDPNNDLRSICRIEEEADAHLITDGTSVDVIASDLVSMKDMDELNSDFQDSFLSTECSLMTDQDTDSDPSIFLTKDNETLSPGSLGHLGFLSLSRLWKYCLDPIITCDEDCLVLVHSLLMEISNMLLNEDDLNKCLCVSADNILLNQRGKIFLAFSGEYCDECYHVKSSMKYYDAKYISSIGEMILQVLEEDKKCVTLSQHIVHMLTRMMSLQSTNIVIYGEPSSDDLIINDVLQFCRAQMSVKAVSCRYALARLFEYWNSWNMKYHQKLKNLPYKYLIDISNCMDPIKTFLRPIPSDWPITRPMEIKDIFSNNPSALAGLKHVIPNRIVLNDTHPIQKPSAFRPYNKPPSQPSSSSSLSQPIPNIRHSYIQQNASNIICVPNCVITDSASTSLPQSTITPALLKSSTHFKPIILAAEKNSVRTSHEYIFSPITDLNDPVITYNNPTVSLTLPNKTTSQNFPTSQLQDNCSVLTNNNLRKSQVNLTVGVIEKAINNAQISTNPRQILVIADFALSLENVSEFIFKETLRQRFGQISWPEYTLDTLYKCVNKIDDNIEIETEKDDGDDDVDGNVFSYYETDEYKEKTRSVPKQELNKRHFNSSESSSACKSVSRTLPHSIKSIQKLPPLPTKIKIKTIDSSKSADESKPSPRQNTDVKDGKIKKVYAQNNTATPKRKGSSDIDDSPINVTSKSTTYNNQLSIRESVVIGNPQPIEDISFYETIFPTTLLCFPATLIFCNLNSNFQPDFSINRKTIKDVLESFTKLNQSVQFKFRQLFKTSEMIKKCSDKTDKKIRKQFLLDLREQELYLQSQIMTQMKYELSIAEYDSVNLKYIIGTSNTNENSINQSGALNFQTVSTDSLIGCLFIKNAINSGLLYEFLLIYREFLTPSEFLNKLSKIFNDIQLQIKNEDPNNQTAMSRARNRLLFILLCWIDGFYVIDLSDRIISSILKLVSNQLSCHMCGVNNLIENTLDSARTNKLSSLTFQFTTFLKGSSPVSQKVREVDIEQYFVEQQDKISEKFSGKWKLPISLSNILIGGYHTSFSTNHNREKSYLTNQNWPISQDSFSIFDLSSEELGICLTLIQQQAFNEVHPCHFIKYFNSLQPNDDGILDQIKQNRFSSTNKKSSKEHKEIINYLQLSGRITQWIVAEIKSISDTKLQVKIVKKLLQCCHACYQLNNQSGMSSILEGLDRPEFQKSSFWSLLNTKSNRLNQELHDNLKTMSIEQPEQHQQSLATALLNGRPLLPCPTSILIQLKLASVGSCRTSNGQLKWNRLKKMSDILDHVRLCKQFQYISNNTQINKLKQKLSSRIDHLTSFTSSSLYHT